MQEPILSYANGRGAKNIHSDVPDPETGKCKRSELRQEDFLSIDHRAPAMIYDYDEHHGGDDVALWATGKYLGHFHISFYIIGQLRYSKPYLRIIAIFLGPMSYLFHKTHEQSYVAHVIGYSMCIGPYANDIDCRRPVFSGTSNGSSIKSSICICFSSELFALFFLYLIRNQCNIHV